ncbi:OmpA family protein [Zhihengliuella sp.]|uniref:OmpA family protein n=1 Tax=Zhihengliuella sp. TaxID=1954483 RepID=UPI00281140FF|nr:OmpA family protein [Zhihengliuella sp.]
MNGSLRRPREFAVRLTGLAAATAVVGMLAVTGAPEASSGNSTVPPPPGAAAPGSDGGGADPADADVPVDDLTFVVEDLDLPVEGLVFGSSSLSGGVKEEGEIITLSGEVLFEPNSDTLTADAEEELQRLVQELEERSPRRLAVVGHTDDVQSDAHNQDLSERRARTIADEISREFGDRVDLEVSGRGEAEPIAHNETEEGRQLNRRVEVTVLE